jgi:hypothetical protein
MPLRDHFHPPLSDSRPWDGVHGQWPAMIVLDLFRRMPTPYTASPRVHLGAEFEIDIAAFDEPDTLEPGSLGEGATGVTATAVWAPPKPTMAVDVELEKQDEYEVLIHNRAKRLVAAVEIVSPANKDRPEHRRNFAMKCAALMQQGVSVSIIDLVTVGRGNLYLEMLDLLGESDPSFSADTGSIYVSSCRWREAGESWKLESWAYPLQVNHPLPTLPLWLASDLAVPLELEQTYEETCRVLRIKG